MGTSSSPGRNSRRKSRTRCGRRTPSGTERSAASDRMAVRGFTICCSVGVALLLRVRCAVNRWPRPAGAALIQAREVVAACPISMVSRYAGRACIAYPRRGAQSLRVSAPTRADRPSRHHRQSQAVVSPVSRGGAAGAAPTAEAADARRARTAADPDAARRTVVDGLYARHAGGGARVGLSLDALGRSV